ncbi:MAG: DUF1080 domain-containing protein [Limisphaerales bacterium]
MKSAALILFLTAKFCLAADSITPTNHIELFNGRDFSGFTFCMKDDADPLQTWSVTNGIIHCTGKPTGYLRTTQAYSNYFLTVEWRFVKIAPKADNTGILVHIQSPDKVWPTCVQVQGKHGRQGDLFLMAGAEAWEHKGSDANTPVPMQGESAEKPIGEWNICKTTCYGNLVTPFINGKMVNRITGCTIASGAIGIQSEGGELEIRKMSLDPVIIAQRLQKIIQQEPSGTVTNHEH